MITRSLVKQVSEDLKEKMVFLGGPSQSGKTTLAKSLSSESKQMYLNWDNDLHRRAILKQEFKPKPLWIFDEIHKYKKWRNYIKGVYDTLNGKTKIIVTGSARLDYYRFSGDSLQGRYHYLRLFPLTFKEIGGNCHNDLMELFNLGGFPEPFSLSSKKKADRWSNEYATRFIQEDLISLERVNDIGSLELMMLRLPELVSSPLSINNLREDLQINFKTVARWLDISERLYSIFRLLPLGGTIIKAVKKERKHYHYDWNLIENEGARFENMIALHLLTYVSFLEDSEGSKIELRFFRDIEGREVDFVIVKNKKPIMLIECKLSDGPITKELKYLKNKYPKCEAYQVYLNGTKDYLSKDGIRICPAHIFLKNFI